jgi:hypothetical protein
MADIPQDWRIAAEKGYNYVVDGWGNKKFWLLDDRSLSSVDGREHKKGWLKDYDSKWCEVRWYNSVVAYVKK